MLYEIMFEVEENTQLNKDIYLLKLKAEKPLPQIHPGQFFEIRTGSGTYPLLRRPFSVYRQYGNFCGIEIIYKVVGKGTRLLTEKTPGDKIQGLGPLGNYFSFDSLISPVWLIGGGIGIPPVVFAGKTLQQSGVETVLFYGGRTAGDIILSDDLNKIFNNIEISTEDGSAGFKGFVTSLVTDRLGKNKPSQILACGPTPMLKAVSVIGKEYGIKTQVSMETFMGCGFGVCNGCAIPVIDKIRKYNLVCKDGPVFYADKILWSSNEFA